MPRPRKRRHSANRGWGGYADPWTHIKARDILYSTNDYIVYFDADGDVNWETSRKYDKSLSNEPKYDSLALDDILDDHAILEVRLDQNTDKRTARAVRRLIGEAVASALGFNYVSARRMIGEARSFINTSNERDLNKNHPRIDKHELERTEAAGHDVVREGKRHLGEEGPATMAGDLKVTPDKRMEWDVFISHASEDKEDFSRPLAERLRQNGLRVWFDEFTLTVGDSLRRSIDRGLAKSRFGVVVISPNFLQKEWPQKELDGLVAREIGGVKVILPVWHNIKAEEIRAYSPILADRLAASSDKGLEHVTSLLMQAVQRKVSIAAKNEDFGTRIED